MSGSHDDVFFPADAAEWRAWLEANHATAREVRVGFWKKGSGRANLSWSEAVDEALCFGWIDGVRHTLDEHSYTNRFTPRRPGSTWSRINIEKVERLTAEGRMRPAGLAAFEARQEARSGTYSYENRPDDLEPADAERLRAVPGAWEFWQSQPPGYRRSATWWVVSAKRPETRARRLERLAEHCAAGERLPHLVSPARRR